ncbi:MAG: patatin-like phospholipase family protein [Candidatus Binatia bacterium]
MRTEPNWPPRRALTLAGGGITGGLYEVGVLLALDTVFEDFSTLDFDLYVGASAGAFVAALLANGLAPEWLWEAVETHRSTLPRLAGSQFLSIPWHDYLRSIVDLGVAVPRMAWNLWKNWNDALVLDTVASLGQHLPRGIFSLDGLEAYVRKVLNAGGRTDDFRRLRRRLLIPATALDTGAIEVFGNRPQDPTPISRAVSASAAIPLVFAPVRIDGVDYVDACVTKSAHAGLAVSHGARLVVVVNPIRPLVLQAEDAGRLARAGALAIAGQSFRVAIQRRLHDGLRRHAYEHPETDIVLIEPYERDLELFDLPLMTYTLQTEVIRRGYRTTIKKFLADWNHHLTVFARHGITLAPRARVESLAERWSSAAARAAA